MIWFIVCIFIPIVCIVTGIAAALHDRDSSHRFSLAILGAMLGFIPTAAFTAYETHEALNEARDNAYESAENGKQLRNRIDVLLGLPGEPQRAFIDEYVTGAKAIEAFKSPFLSRQSATQENDFRDAYSKLAQGIIDVPTNRLMSVAIDLTNEAKQEILATSVFSTDWNKQWSSEYWGLQKRRIADGIQVYRIFILNGQSPAECDPVFRQHANAGVHVSFIDSDQLNADEKKDLIVIDDKLAAELVFTIKDQVMSGVVMIDPKLVTKDRDLFLNLAKRAHPYNRP